MTPLCSANLRRTVGGSLAGAGALLFATVAFADSLPEMGAETIRRVTETWQDRVFLVVADAGPGHSSVDKVLEDPRALYRKPIPRFVRRSQPGEVLEFGNVTIEKEFVTTR